MPQPSLDPSPRPFRFGVVAARAASAADWRAKAQRVEALGYATLLMPDRVGGTLGPLPALATAAAATTTLRVGTYVLAAGLVPPSLLARDVATLDLLTDGRVEVGLGTGVSEADYQRTGIPFGSPGERVERLAATLGELKQALAELSTAATPAVYPSPVQRPHPPILVAGGGQRVLGVAAAHADSVALSSGTDLSLAALAQRVAWLREAAGARFAAIELGFNLAGLAVDGVVPPQVRQRMRHFMHADADAIARAGSPFLPRGSITDVGDQVERLRAELGISYVHVADDLMEAFAPVVASLAGR